MRQIVVIGGGETHDTYDAYLGFLRRMEFNPEPREGKGWKANLQHDLGERYQVFVPKMPNHLNAKYEEWCIYFRNVLEHVEPGAVFVGHSLGGIFLMKFFHEYNGHADTLQARSFILVGTPYGERTKGDLGDFDTVDLPRSKKLGELHVFHSRDDEIVRPADAWLYKANYLDAQVHMFEGRGHFYKDEHFPELVKVIKSLWRK